jgi:multidrug efflux system membrane fusion protein
MPSHPLHSTSRRAALVIAALAPLAACGHAAPPPAPLQTVREGVVTLATPTVAERYSVTIQAFREVDLAFKSPGIVDRLLDVKGADGRVRGVQAGDHVGANAELARVRPIDYDQRVAQADAQVREAQAQINQAEALLRQAQQDDDRATKLYQSKSLTKPEFDQAEARLRATTAQVDAARAGLTAAEAGRSQATLAREDASVRAPFAGWIGARNVEVGGLVGNATPAFSLIDTHLVKASFAVPDTSLKSVRQGQQVFVWLDAMSDRVAGTITSVAPAADPRTHVYSVDVTIDNTSEAIRPGMVGAVVLGEAPRPVSHIVVPLAAIVRDPANPKGVAVYRLDDKDGRTIATAQPVTTGDAMGNAIEILTGLAAGQRIVILGGELLRSGDEVRVLR